MIETEQSISIGCAIEDVWEYVKDIRNWANLMPGAQNCTVIDANDSRWTLKVGAGGLVRTVTALVHVEHWDAPAGVEFSYRLQGDPVLGSGLYRAVQTSAHETAVTLRIRVEGSGPMSRLWEAMSTPLLPQWVRSFAERLKAEIEKAAPAASTRPAARTRTRGRFLDRLGRLGKTLLIRCRSLSA